MKIFPSCDINQVKPSPKLHMNLFYYFLEFYSIYSNTNATSKEKPHNFKPMAKHFPYCIALNEKANLSINGKWYLLLQCECDGWCRVRLSDSFKH